MKDKTKWWNTLKFLVRTSKTTFCGVILSKYKSGVDEVWVAMVMWGYLSQNYVASTRPIILWYAIFYPISHLSDPQRRTLLGLDMPQILLKERSAFGNVDTGSAWLSTTHIIRKYIILIKTTICIRITCSFFRGRIYGS